MAPFQKFMLKEHTQNLRNEILEYRKSMEEDIAIADIKVQMEGESKMEKEKQEVVQKGGPERWSRNEKCHFAPYRQQWKYHFPRDC